MKWSESRSVMSDSLWPHELYIPWNSLGQNTGVGSFSLLQGIFTTQGSNSGLPNCRWILFQLSYKGSPRILEWVDYSFSSKSSPSRNQTRVSCIAGGFFTNWIIREAWCLLSLNKDLVNEWVVSDPQHNAMHSANFCWMDKLLNKGNFISLKCPFLAFSTEAVQQGG